MPSRPDHRHITVQDSVRPFHYDSSLQHYLTSAKSHPLAARSQLLQSNMGTDRTHATSSADDAPKVSTTNEDSRTKSKYI